MLWNVLFLFLYCCSDVLSQGLLTRPLKLFVPNGGEARFLCMHSSGLENHHVGWYQDKMGQGIRFIYVGDNKRGEGIPDQFSGATSQPTLTQPASQSGSLGGTMKLSCAISSSASNIHWLQQRSGESLRFVHYDGGSRGPGIPDRFTGTRSGNNGYLTITNLQTEDEAHYYCYMWYSNSFHSDTN